MSDGAVKIDAHVHLWAPRELAADGTFPYAGQLLGAGTAAASEPPMPGHAKLLLTAMHVAGVSGALVVQPGNHMFDHSYVTSVLRQHPGKLAGCLLADPARDGSGVAAMEALVTREGYVAARFNPYLWPEGELMTNDVGRALYRRAGQLGIPVGHMPFKGFLRHVDEIEALLNDCPETKCIIDHFGFCKAGDLGSEEWRRLLALAAYPQVYVKASALFRVSAAATPDGGGWPYPDAAAALRRLVDAFSARRVMWGTDWPWVTEQCGYFKAWQVLDGVQAGSGNDGGGAAAPLLTDEERRWVEGGTARALFPAAWGGG